MLFVLCELTRVLSGPGLKLAPAFRHEEKINEREKKEMERKRKKNDVVDVDLMMNYFFFVFHFHFITKWMFLCGCVERDGNFDFANTKDFLFRAWHAIQFIVEFVFFFCFC